MGKNRGVPVLVMLAASALVAGASAAAPARPRGAASPAGRVASPAGRVASPAGRVASPAASQSTADPDSGLTLKSGEEGTVFRTLTVEGEDRIHFEVERPGLRLEVDPRTAPGLEWGTARDVLDRSTPDLAAPYLELSARQASPWVAHPWLSHFGSGAVARFHPQADDVERWKLTVADARGEEVTSFQGRGNPPHEIAWDGRSKEGRPVTPGLTYSYVFEAFDKAGNKRRFVGPGFRVSAYRTAGAEGPVMLFSGAELSGSDGNHDLSSDAGANPDDAPPIVLVAAIWLNQSLSPTQPVRISVAARSIDEADRLGPRIAQWLAPALLGDPSRLTTASEVQADAPDEGIVRIAAVGARARR